MWVGFPQELWTDLDWFNKPVEMGMEAHPVRILSDQNQDQHGARRNGKFWHGIDGGTYYWVAWVPNRIPEDM